MAHINGATLGSDFTVNLGANPVIVLNATNWSYAYTNGAWADIGLTAPFAYDPAFGNLVMAPWVRLKRVCVWAVVVASSVDTCWIF